MGTGIGGSNAVLLPQFVSGGGWESQIVISNPGSSALTVRVDLFNSDGTPLSTTLNGQTGSSFIGLTIPAGGVLTLSPKDWDSND
jgi:hypothetical protein